MSHVSRNECNQRASVVESDRDNQQERCETESERTVKISKQDLYTAANELDSALTTLETTSAAELYQLAHDEDREEFESHIENSLDSLVTTLRVSLNIVDTDKQFIIE